MRKTNNPKISGRSRSEIPNDAIEEQTKKIPNLLFLGLGVASLVGQFAARRYLKKRFLSPILGVWGPVFLILGLYNKMVKFEDKLLPSSVRHTLH